MSIKNIKKSNKYILKILYYQNFYNTFYLINCLVADSIISCSLALQLCLLQFANHEVLCELTALWQMNCCYMVSI